MVMIQKSDAIVKAYNGEQSPLFVELRGADDFFQPLKFHLELIDLWMCLAFCIKRERQASSLAAFSIIQVSPCRIFSNYV